MDVRVGFPVANARDPVTKGPEQGRGADHAGLYGVARMWRSFHNVARTDTGETALIDAAIAVVRDQTITEAGVRPTLFACIEKMVLAVASCLGLGAATYVRAR